MILYSRVWHVSWMGEARPVKSVRDSTVAGVRVSFSHLGKGRVFSPPCDGGVSGGGLGATNYRDHGRFSTRNAAALGPRADERKSSSRCPRRVSHPHGPPFTRGEGDGACVIDFPSCPAMLRDRHSPSSVHSTPAFSPVQIRASSDPQPAFSSTRPIAVVSPERADEYRTEAQVIADSPIRQSRWRAATILTLVLAVGPTMARAQQPVANHFALRSA